MQETVFESAGLNNPKRRGFTIKIEIKNIGVKFGLLKTVTRSRTIKNNTLDARKTKLLAVKASLFCNSSEEFDLTVT